MQLRIQAPRLDLPAEERRTIERRLRLVLGRHAAGIERVQVTLSAGTDAGPPSRCRIRVLLRDGATLSVEDRAEGLTEAAGAAAWRLAHRMELPRAARRGGALAGASKRRSS